MDHEAGDLDFRMVHLLMTRRRLLLGPIDTYVAERGKSGDLFADDVSLLARMTAKVS